MKILCIDIGGTNTKYSLFDNETPSKIKSIPTPPGLKIEDMKKCIFPIVDETIKLVGKLDFISISTCGQMRDNKVLFTSSKPGYIGCDWKEILWNKYKIPCVANNDLHCAVMGEYHYGLSKTDIPDNFICLSIGTGINISTIINGNIFTGDGNLSCYLDNMTDLDGNNQFKSASTASLLKLYKAESGIDLDGKQFIDLLKTEDDLSLKCYKIWINRIAHILKNVLYMFNINVITACGGILNSNYPILDDVKSELIKIAAPPYCEYLNLTKSKLSSSQIYGAYAFAMKELNK